MRHLLSLPPALWATAGAVWARTFGALGPAGRSRRDRVRGERSAGGVPLAVLADLVTWHDRSGDVVRSGADAAEAFGFSRFALAGGGLLARVHISDRPVYLKALSDAACGAGDAPVEFRLHVGDPTSRLGQGFSNPDRSSAGGAGPVVWVAMRAHRLDASPGSDERVIAFTRDISGQRRHDEDLETARREAERANEMKSRFLATVSHELRTPLNAIIGFSELLSADHPFIMTEERRKEYAVIIRNSGTHLLEIVNTLLDMSKIESGNFHFEPEPFSLRELADSCCDLMQLKAAEARVSLRRAIDPGLPDFPGDRRACRQILINLLSNAIKFTPAGGAVTVSLRAVGQDRILSVADTGCGIAEADLPRLGDPFFQAGDLHRHHEGTGLGLSVVRGLVGLHGGRMSIESGTGAGTAVTVSLPADRAAAPGRPVAVQTAPRFAQPVDDRRVA